MPVSAIQDWPELDDGNGVRASVGSLAANAFGLHDVCGNVWELCLAGYDENLLGRRPVQDPGSPWNGSDLRLARGGSYDHGAHRARSLHRRSTTHAVAGADLGVPPARPVAAR